MISPEKFRANEFTMDDNVFQSKKVADSKVSIQALEEFEKLKNTISDNGVSVYSIKDESIHDTPDAVFPNNWISFHNKNNAVIYPMFAENRRLERQSDILRKLQKKGIN
ncbi:MAG: amidinotransferase, partial [Cryomorphaceae bacterium]|nr:amidinotransferase [Cryomorphaceae bacterium]